MHIKKYDFEYSRRSFMEKTAKGVGAAGILQPMWALGAQTGSVEKAYPEELTNIEAYTKGKVKVGDVINKDNIELVQDLVDPMLFWEVTQDNRSFYIAPTDMELEKMYPPYYLDATLRNYGQATFDEKGNVVTKEGKPWIGGAPFPDIETGAQAQMNISISWGRHDNIFFAIPTYALAPDGDIDYNYDFVWAEQQSCGLVHPNRGGQPYLEGREEWLRYNSLWFTAPNDAKGTAVMNNWHYDQSRFPEFFGYLPAFKRVRRFPTNQRFEPVIAGLSVFQTDFWAAGDPMLTWSNHKIVGRQPMLMSMHYNWHPEHEYWDHPLVGGPKDQTYMYGSKSLIPDVIVVELEPTGFPRAPVSKRRVYFDARSSQVGNAISFDRRDQMWKSFEFGHNHWEQGSHVLKTTDGRVETGWSWTHANDIQSRRMTRFHHAKSLKGGQWPSAWDPEPDGDLISGFMTHAALRRLGT